MVVPERVHRWTWLVRDAWDFGAGGGDDDDDDGAVDVEGCSSWVRVVGYGDDVVIVVDCCCGVAGYGCCLQVEYHLSLRALLSHSHCVPCSPSVEEKGSMVH